MRRSYCTLALFLITLGVTLLLSSLVKSAFWQILIGLVAVAIGLMLCRR